MITKHEDREGNEYLSKLVSPNTFLLMDANGDMIKITPERMAKYVSKYDLKVVEFLDE